MTFSDDQRNLQNWRTTATRPSNALFAEWNTRLPELMK